jgi:hypothetical protein
MWDDEAEDNFWTTITSNSTPYMYGIFAKPSPLGSMLDLENMGCILNKDFPFEGITHPYMYGGSYKTFAELHTEDCDLYSVNYLRGGSDKLW